MAKSDYAPKNEAGMFSGDHLHLSYVLVLLTVLIANFSSSETLTLLVFITLLLVYAIRKYDSRIPIGFALLLLVVCAFVLAFKDETVANQIAIYAYYYLVVGVVLQLIEYIKNPEVDENEV